MLLTTPNNQPVDFTQNDTALLDFVATDDQGNVVDITGATFQTQILGVNGQDPATFDDGQHTILDAENGLFSLALAQSDTMECGIGLHKEILTQITIGASVQMFRGVNILTVYSAEPVQ